MSGSFAGPKHHHSQVERDHEKRKWDTADVEQVSNGIRMRVQDGMHLAPGAEAIIHLYLRSRFMCGGDGPRLGQLLLGD